MIVAWPLMGFLLVVQADSVRPPIVNDSNDETNQSSRKAEPDVGISQLLMAHLPLTDRFESERHAWTNLPPADLITDDFHIVRFSGGDERLTVWQMNAFLRDCIPANRIHANHVAITIHYDCPNKMRARLVYNFSEGRVKRVMVGDIPQELRCSGGLCIDKAEK